MDSLRQGESLGGSKSIIDWAKSVGAAYPLQTNPFTAARRGSCVGFNGRYPVCESN